MFGFHGRPRPRCISKGSRDFPVAIFQQCNALTTVTPDLGVKLNFFMSFSCFCCLKYRSSSKSVVRW